MTKSTFSLYFHIRILGVLLLASCEFGAKNQGTDHQVAGEIAKCTLCPQFSEGQDTIAFVNEVRHFVAKRADVGMVQNTMCDSFASYPVHSFPINEYLNIFQNDLGVSTCGLSSKLMVSILVRNGIDAYTYDFGFENTRLTHVIVLVKHQGKLLVFDPFLNYELLDKSGQNLGLIELIDMIGRKKVELSFSKDTVSAELNLDYNIVPEFFRNLFLRDSCRFYFDDRELIRDNTYKVMIDKCYQCEKDRRCVSFIRDFEAELRKRTDFNSFLEGVILKIYGVNGASDCVYINDIIETAIYSQHNMGKRVRGKL